MSDKFDELAKGLAQSVTRRQALRRFGVGLAGVLLATLGLASKPEAVPKFICDCSQPDFGCSRYRQKGLYHQCIKYCGSCLQP